MEECNTFVAELWSDVYQAVTEKEHKPEKFKKFYIGKIETPKNIPVHQRKKKVVRSDVKYVASQFWLNMPFKHVPFSKREVQVLFLIGKGATNQKVATTIGLSVRTIEYYIKNIRKKTLASSKADLIQLILGTNFFERVNATVLTE